MKLIVAAAAVLLLGGCATMQQPKPSAPKIMKAPVKHAEPCPCSPTANQVVKKRFYDGFRVRWFH
jgi:uncharacterized lipoprotein YajG